MMLNRNHVLNRNQILLLHIFNSLNTIETKKRMQKMVFLCKSLNIFNFDENYIYHYYGPYSFELAQELDDLEALNLIKAEEKDGGFIYSITDEGRGFSNNIFAKLPPETNKLLDLLINICNTMNKETPSFLEVASTATFLKENGYKDEDITSKLKDLKHNLISKSHIDINKAINYKTALQEIVNG